MAETVARAARATKMYGSTLALDHVDLDVRAGEVVGLLGANGAGKSTLVKLWTGVVSPTSGHVELFGGSPGDPHRRRLVGTMPQEAGPPPDVRVLDCLSSVGSGYDDPMTLDEMLERFDLHDLAARSVSGLTGGQRSRLGAALAFAGRPRLAFLDEPTAGLDATSRRMLWDCARAYVADGGTLVVSSQDVEEIGSLADRVVVLADGRVLADDTVPGLQRMASRLWTAAYLPRGPMRGLDDAYLTVVTDARHMGWRDDVPRARERPVRSA